MNLAELKQRLRTLAGPDIEARLTEFEREQGLSDPDQLLIQLREHRLISTALYTELAAGSPIEVRSVAAVAEDKSLKSGRTDKALAALGPSSRAGSTYTLLGLLGRGAMGEVLVAKDLELRRRVAYKRMVPEVRATSA